jgi:hypothetical protein
MGSFEELMNERRKIQKALDDKSSLEEYKKKLAATIDLSEVASSSVATSTKLSTGNISTTSSSPPLSETFNNTVIPVPLDDSTDMMDKEVATEFVTMANMSTTVPDPVSSEVSHSSSMEFIIPSSPLPSEMATTPSSQMAIPTIPSSTLEPASSFKPSLKEIQDRIYHERGLMFEGRPVPVDPEDSRRLAIPPPKAKSRGSHSYKTTSPSPDLVALQREMAKRRDDWMAQVDSTEVAKKKNLATAVYEESQKTTPFPVPIPAMPFYNDLVNSSMATGSTLQLPMDVGPGSTKINSSSLILDMGTGRGLAITGGLVGSGMFLKILLKFSDYFWQCLF